MSDDAVDQALEACRSCSDGMGGCTLMWSSGVGSLKLIGGPVVDRKPLQVEYMQGEMTGRKLIRTTVDKELLSGLLVSLEARNVLLKTVSTLYLAYP